MGVRAWGIAGGRAAGRCLRFWKKPDDGGGGGPGSALEAEFPIDTAEVVSAGHGDEGVGAVFGGESQGGAEQRADGVGAIGRGDDVLDEGDSLGAAIFEEQEGAGDGGCVVATQDEDANVGSLGMSGITPVEVGGVAVDGDGGGLLADAAEVGGESGGCGFESAIGRQGQAGSTSRGQVELAGDVGKRRAAGLRQDFAGDPAGGTVAGADLLGKGGRGSPEFLRPGDGRAAEAGEDGCGLVVGGGRHGEDVSGGVEEGLGELQAGEDAATSDGIGPDGVVGDDHADRAGLADAEGDVDGAKMADDPISVGEDPARGSVASIGIVPALPMPSSQPAAAVFEDAGDGRGEQDVNGPRRSEGSTGRRRRAAGTATGGGAVAAAASSCSVSPVMRVTG